MAQLKWNETGSMLRRNCWQMRVFSGDKEYWEQLTQLNNITPRLDHDSTLK